MSIRAQPRGKSFQGHASHIKKTTNGRGGRIIGETRQKTQILLAGSVPADGEIDERKAARGFCEDKTPRAAHKEKIGRPAQYIPSADSKTNHY
jgi:hypothetical protein